MNFKELTFLIIIFLIMPSCSNNDSSTNPPSTSAFIPLPLKTGNRWTYVNNSGGENIYILTDTVINNRTVHKMPDDNYWFDVDKDGFYYQDDILYGMKVYNLSSSPEIIFPKNPTLGQTWNAKDYEMKIESINEQITVPAGSFTCYKISARETTSVSIKFDSWWANGKGIIKLKGRIGSDLRELKTIQLN